MSELLKFMSDSPILTVIILMVVGQFIHGVVVAMRGCRKPHLKSCPMCGLSFTEKKKEE